MAVTVLVAAWTVLTASTTDVSVWVLVVPGTVTVVVRMRYGFIWVTLMVLTITDWIVVDVVAVIDFVVSAVDVT